MCRLLCLLLFVWSVPFAGAAPITVQEIDFLLRQHTPESEILIQTQQRRLLQALDPASTQQLTTHGASAAFLEALRNPQLILPAAEAAALAQRAAVTQRAAQQQAAAPVPQVAPPKATPPKEAQNHFIDQFQDKLVRLQGDELRPVDSQQLRPVRLFILYRAAQGNAPSRQFTPQLVDYYQRMKGAHPELEVIFLSADRDEFNMLNAMRTTRMPWPAMRSGTAGPLTAAFCGPELPWLVCVDESGHPLTTNGADKKYIAPEQILPAIDYLLAHLK